MFSRCWSRRSVVLLILAPLVVIGTKVAQAQVVDLQNDRVPVVEVHSLWRFHTGDDPDGKLGWIDPGFDDSSWQLLRADQPVSKQGYPSYSGMLWYRFRLVLPPHHRPLALYIPGIGTGYQVFADGQLIGQLGGLPPQERPLFADTGGSLLQRAPLGQVIAIPRGTADRADSVVIAIRVWIWSNWAFVYDVQPFRPTSIGDMSLMNDEKQASWNYQFWSLSPENTLLLGYLLAAAAGLGLFVLRRDEREYLWFAAVELLYAGYCIWDVYPVFHPVPYHGYLAIDCPLLLLRGVCLSMFFVTLLKQPRRWLFWSSIGATLLGSVTFIPPVMGWMSDVDFISAIFIAWIPFMVCQILMLAMAARRGNLDARLLLGPFGLQYGAILGGGLLIGLAGSQQGGPVVAFVARRWEELVSWPFPISVQNIADFVTQISILAILVLRFARTRRDEERFKSELDAARSVQQVLIPEEIPSIPGFSLDCIYKPAGQVGGDFFQILPTADAGALIVIGDVSGKGMPAAMTVSLLVGTVRTLAQYTDSPAAILSAMNQLMISRSKDGFTTCLALRLTPDGAATIANAGHLAPYLGVEELAIEGDIPLGLSAESTYTESCFHLDMGKELTLLTDGVAEARAKTGELFGFERTASILILSAEHIAATAIAFGQEDDITVLKVRRFRRLIKDDITDYSSDSRSLAIT